MSAELCFCFLALQTCTAGIRNRSAEVSYVRAKLIAVSAELQSGSVELRRIFAVLQNVSIEFRFCFKVFGTCFAKLRNCFTELICIGKELSGVSTKLETGSARP